MTHSRRSVGRHVGGENQPAGFLLGAWHTSLSLPLISFCVWWDFNWVHAGKGWKWFSSSRMLHWRIPTLWIELGAGLCWFLWFSPSSWWWRNKSLLWTHCLSYPGPLFPGNGTVVSGKVSWEWNREAGLQVPVVWVAVKLSESCLPYAQEGMGWSLCITEWLSWLQDTVCENSLT